MIYVTGDIHGGCTMNNIIEWEEGKNLTHDDYLVIVGDFGIPWKFSITEDDLIYWIESRHSPFSIRSEISRPHLF